MYWHTCNVTLHGHKGVIVEVPKRVCMITERPNNRKTDATWETLDAARSVTQTITMSSIKGPSASQHDGSELRIAIVHARWNKTVVDALVDGAVTKLRECGVKEKNLVVQSVPGSFELPLACSRWVFSFPFSWRTRLNVV